jgi:hypothetical protein
MKQGHHPGVRIPAAVSRQFDNPSAESRFVQDPARPTFGDTVASERISNILDFLPSLLQAQ